MNSLQIFALEIASLVNVRGHYRGLFRTFELRVLTVIDCPKIAGAKGP